MTPFRQALLAIDIACDALHAECSDDLAEHGMPSAAERRRVRELALREILEPAVRSLTPVPAANSRARTRTASATS